MKTRRLIVLPLVIGLTVLAAACTEFLPIEAEGASDATVAAVAVDRDGVVYGVRRDSITASVVFAWDGSTVRTLESFGFREGADVAAANNAGVVVGSRFAYGSGTGRFSWARRWSAAGPEQLPPLPDGLPYSEAYDVNDVGDVVGRATPTGGGSVPVRWPAAGGVERLALPAGYVLGAATGINERGDIVGWATSTGFGAAAVLWAAPDHIPSLLAVPAPADADVRARDLNDDGVIIGTAGPDATGPDRRAVVWDGADSVAVDLAGAGSTATDINAAGTIVGSVTDEHGIRAARWSGPERTLTIMSEPDHSPAVANGVNDDGVLVGTATEDGRTRAARFFDPPE